MLCDKKVPIKLKDKVYKTVIKSTMTYGAECWAVREKDDNRLPDSTRNDGEDWPTKMWRWSLKVRKIQTPKSRSCIENIECGSLNRLETKGNAAKRNVAQRTTAIVRTDAQRM